MNNQKGFAHIVLIVGIAVVLAAGSFAYYRVTNNKTSQENQKTTQANEAEIKNFADCVAAGNPVMESDPEKCAYNDEIFTKEGADEVTENQETTNEPVEETVKNVESTPTPAPTPEPQPNYSLYSTPVPKFENCPNHVEVYVVNKNGAKLADTYYSSKIVKTLSFGTKAYVGCQDGEGTASMSVKITGNEEFGLAGTPADFRTTYPYN